MREPRIPPPKPSHKALPQDFISINLPERSPVEEEEPEALVHVGLVGTGGLGATEQPQSLVEHRPRQAVQAVVAQHVKHAAPEDGIKARQDLRRRGEDTTSAAEGKGDGKADTVLTWPDRWVSDSCRSL